MAGFAEMSKNNDSMKAYKKAKKATAALNLSTKDPEEGSLINHYFMVYLMLN